MSWESFEQAADRYESWYATPRGRRADRSERALLAWLLGWFPGVRRVLEIGCGSGHFTQSVAARGCVAIGLDRSLAMLREARALLGGGSLVLADAHRLPLRERAVDVVLLVTTLEFLASPEQALTESVRVAERGLALVVLNRCSLGAVSRRWGPQSRGALLAGARDVTHSRLREVLERTTGERLIGIHSRSTLLPRPFDRLLTRLPFGDVLGVAVELRTGVSREPGGRDRRPIAEPGSSRRSGCGGSLRRLTGGPRCRSS